MAAKKIARSKILKAPKDNPNNFKPASKAQSEAWTIIDNSLITFLIGPAGTSKTHTAVAWAINAVRKEYYQKIAFTRPVVEACESLGWLPGDIDHKLAPYMLPLKVCAEKVGKDNIIIDTFPIAYLRGVTFEHCVCILDEAQNCTRAQLKLYLTRFGKGCKMIICGDSSQSDIHNSGLYKVATELTDINGINVFKFTKEDNVRHPLVQLIVDKFDSADNQKSL